MILLGNIQLIRTRINKCACHFSLIFTSFTAPELDVHIVLVLAKPTVDPSKSTPLNKEEGRNHLHGSSQHLSFLGNLRDELRVVVFGPWQKAPLSPFQEASEGELGVAADLDLIPVRPDVQTDQHDTNADRAIQLPDGSVLA